MGVSKINFSENKNFLKKLIGGAFLKLKIINWGIEIKQKIINWGGKT
jgi:hypothetical protein